MTQHLTPGALQGVRVLDCSRILAGPWCTQILGDLGADVIKIERPADQHNLGGDDTRGWGPPFLADEKGVPTTDSAYFLSANRNKRSLTVDIATEAGQRVVRDLVKQCDIFIENFKVGDLARRGLDWPALRRENPALIYCSITGFGQAGPYADRAGYDFAIQAMGGLMSVTGERDDLPGGGPQKAGIAVADLFTGMYSAVAILAALRHRDATGGRTKGVGQHIDMALLDTQVATLSNLGTNYLVNVAAGHAERVPKRAGNAHQNIVPYQVFKTAPRKDGSRDHIIVAIGNDGQFARFSNLLGQSWHLDARFSTNPGRVSHRDILVPLIAVELSRQSSGDWLDRLEAAGIPCGPINSIAEALADPQVRSRDMVQPCEHPCGTTVDLVSSPIHMSETPPSIRRHPPRLGEHTDEILAEFLNMDASAVAQLRRSGVV